MKTNLLNSSIFISTISMRPMHSDLHGILPLRALISFMKCFGNFRQNVSRRLLILFGILDFLPGLVKHYSLADLRGAQGTPQGSKFFQLHVVFGKTWQNRMLAPPPPWTVGDPTSCNSMPLVWRGLTIFASLSVRKF